MLPLLLAAPPMQGWPSYLARLLVWTSTIRSHRLRSAFHDRHLRRRVGLKNQCQIAVDGTVLLRLWLAASLHVHAGGLPPLTGRPEADHLEFLHRAQVFVVLLQFIGPPSVTKPFGRMRHESTILSAPLVRPFLVLDGLQNLLP